MPGYYFLDTRQSRREIWHISSDVFLLAAAMLFALSGEQYDLTYAGVHNIIQKNIIPRGKVDIGFFLDSVNIRNQAWRNFFDKALGGERYDDPDHPRFSNAHKFVEAVGLLPTEEETGAGEVPSASAIKMAEVCI